MKVNMIERILQSMNILYVEENMKYRNTVSDALKQKINNVFSVSDIKNASTIYNTESVDIIITDIVFSDKKLGINLIKSIREINKSIPIIVISNLDNIDDLIALIKYNITDYVRKPIKLSKLKDALYTSVLKIMTDGKYIITFSDNIEYNVQKNLLIKDNIEIELTSNERKLLNLLLVNKNYILSQDEIINSIWPDKFDISESAFKSLIKRLRTKIGKTAIKNSPGNGYILQIKK